jgi:hypothetical protein
MKTSMNPGRYAGSLYLLASLVGFFAMAYVPKQLIVRGDAATTAANIAAHETLFRWGIAAEVVSHTGFIIVALALYDLLKGVNRRQAKLMVLLIVVAIPIALLNELNSLGALMLVHGADFLSVFDRAQRESMAMFLVEVHGYGFSIAELFWGLWLFPMALLVYRSRFLPRLIGVWLSLAGVAWIALSLSGLLFPEYEGKVYALAQPAFFAEIAFMLWLVVRGAQPPQQE